MKKTQILLIVFIVLLKSSVLISQTRDYPYRWVYAFGSTCETEAGLNRLMEIADSASAHNINGMVLPGRMDRIDNRSPEYLERLKKLNEYLKVKNVELIPAIMSFSWGDALYEDDRNLAAGLPVNDALFVVRNKVAQLKPDHKVALINGNFEQGIDNWTLNRKAERVVKVNEQESREGKNSLEIDVNHNFENEGVVLSQLIKVQPHRLYKITFSLKLNKLVDNSWGVFPVQVKTEEGLMLHHQNPTMKVDGTWYEHVIAFNSRDYDQVKVIINSPPSQEANFLIDNLVIEEAGLLNVLRRPGTPVVVRGEENGIVYTEGKDYAPILDPYRITEDWDESVDFRFDHQNPAIILLPGSSISEGEKLRVSWYHPMYIYSGAIPLCMSAPKVYELLRKKVQRIHEVLNPQKYLMNFEEVRGGNTCAACKARNITMPEMIGDAMKKCVEILKEDRPDVEVFNWGDLFDPNLNAGPQVGNNYFHVNGTYENSWKYVPKEIVMLPWTGRLMDESLKHFHSNGFKTIICCNYDSNEDFSFLNRMIEKTQNMKENVGFVYTSWGDNFDSLGKFGDLLTPNNHK